MLSCAPALPACQEQSLVSRTNEAEGAFQQVWQGRRVSVPFSISLRVVWGLSPKAVMGYYQGDGARSWFRSRP